VASYFVTGPCHLFYRNISPGVGPAVNVAQRAVRPGDINFVGHTEVSPELAEEAQYKPVFCSLSGEAVPDDQVFLGANTKLIVDLQRFDMRAIHALRAPQAGRNFAAGVPVGSETYLDRGRLVQAHGDGYEFWIQFSFFGTVNAANVAAPDALPAGYYFPCCVTKGTYPTRMTRDAKKVRLMIEPMPVRLGITGGYTTFIKTAAAFANLPAPG
jgi:hypothetical protein